MGCHILRDMNDNNACLYCSTDMVAFGRVFHGDFAGEELEAFCQWYAKNGAYRDPRLDPSIGDVQDAWRKTLDQGCTVCHVEGFEPCETGDDGEKTHERKSL